MFRFNIVRNCVNLTKKIGNGKKSLIAGLCSNSQSSNIIAVRNNCALASNFFTQNNISRPLPQLKTCQEQHQVRNSSTGGDHVKIWQLERILSVALIPLLPIALITENAALEAILALGTVMHTHWGLEAIVVDYARPAVVGAALAKAAHLLLYALSVATLAGLFMLIFSGPGIGKSLKKGWAIGEKDAKY